MEHFFVTFFQSHTDVMRQWGVAILFFVAFIESLPILGTFLPGQTTIIFGGFLAKLGFFGFLPALIATICGAVIGDLAGFLLGKKYGPSILKRERWIIDKKHFESTVKLIEGNSIKSIFIGRIHSFARTLMPFAAGMSRVSVKKFIIIDVITAIVWAMLCLTMGFVFGKSFELASVFIGKFFLMATLITIILFAAVSHIRERGKKIAPVDAVIFGVSVSFLYLFVITASSFVSGRFYNILDTKIAHFAKILHAEWFTVLMIFFTTLGGPVVLTLIAIGFIAFLLYKKRISDALFATSAMGIGVILVNILKAIFQRARPIHGLVESVGTSFPSGHAMMATIFAVVLYYVILRKIKDERSRSISIFLATTITFAIGLSRVYLNVHWASDVLAGFAGGIFLSTFVIVIFRLTKTIIKKSKRSHSLPDIP